METTSTAAEEFNQPQETCSDGHPLAVTLPPVTAALVLLGLAVVLAKSRRSQPDR